MIEVNFVFVFVLNCSLEGELNEMIIFQQVMFLVIMVSLSPVFMNVGLLLFT